MSVNVSELRIYPIKSLCAVKVDRLQLKDGIVVGDRQWALVDENGRYYCGKRTPTVHEIRLMAFTPPALATLQQSNEAVMFDLIAQHDEAERWFQRAFQKPKLRLIRNTSTGS
jgi:uncharacterized protein YcbX